MMIRIVTLGLFCTAMVVHAQFDAIRTLQPDQGQEVRWAVDAKVFDSTLEERPAIEKKLLAIFKDSGTSLEGRQYTCRMLRHCASEACIPVLAPELTDPELSAFVRLVFQGLESTEADNALISALPQASAALKPGIIATLGQRGSIRSVRAVAPFLENPDAEIQFAAITALGHIGGKDACTALARAKVLPQFSSEKKLARMKAAGRLDTKQAAQIFMQYRLDNNEQVQTASLIGITKLAPSKFAPEVLAILDSRNPTHRQAAIGLLSSLPTRGLIEGLDSLNPESQIPVIGELSSRNATEAEAIVLSLTDSENELLRNAAFQALGSMGGTASIQPLLASALDNPVAYKSLCALNAEGADAAIIQALKMSGDNAMKGRMLECLALRKTRAALPLFVELAMGDWSRNCKIAIDGIAVLVSEDDFYTYAELLAATDNGKKILALEKSIATAGQRLPDANACTRSLINASGHLKGESEYAVIRALGSIGGDTAHKLLTRAVTSRDPEIKDAAIRGLCNWPNTKVADQLMDLAIHSDNEKYQVLALRGYIRLANGLDEETDAMPMCRQVVEVTDRPDVLISVIACVKRFRSKDTLRFLTPMLDNPAIANEAGWAIYEIPISWRGDPAEAEALGKKILESVTDDELKKRTQARINKISTT